MKIYFIPGLGFDQRIFSKLDLSGFSCEFLEWIEPKEEESLKNYAVRLAETIDTTSDKIVLVGQSLGGVVSQEIAKLIEVDKVILISSIRSRTELPSHFKIIERLNLHKFLTKYRVARSHKYWAESYGYTTKEEQDLFIDMISKQTDSYLQWALKSLSMWQTPDVPTRTEIIQIHGEKDKTFPFKLIQNPTHVVPDAGHFMIYNDTESVAEFLLPELHRESHKD